MPASMHGELQPALRRFKLGGFEITIVMDSKVIREGLTPSHGGPTMADEVQAIARANHIDAIRYHHPFTPMLVNTGKERMLFDTGNGALAREYSQFQGRLPDGRLVKHLRDAGYTENDVDVVVISHGHPDHIGGLLKAGRPVFPNARYVFGAAEYDFWLRGENVRPERAFNRELFVTIAKPLAERATFIKPGDDVVSGIQAIDAAGHSPGMMAFLVESEGKRLLNWADTCGHYVISIKRPDLHLDVDDDKDGAVTTRQRLLDMAATDGLLVTGYHMPFPAIGYIEREPTGFRWIPHSYQMDL
jgi:glyoxylase-like metal-dependent hydrolase (beta-lactamase superfamily II)